MVLPVCAETAYAAQLESAGCQSAAPEVASRPLTPW